MAINIFSGNSGKGKARKGTPTSPTSTPASAHGSTATIQTGSGLFKGGLGSAIGKIGGLAAKYGNLIPGVGGVVSTVGKLAQSVNDPEWWQNVPCSGVSTNVPLQLTTSSSKMANVNGAVETCSTLTLRPAVLEFSSGWIKTVTINGSSVDIPLAILPTTAMVSTYLMQNVRKVVNAVPLQVTGAYRDVLTANATALALKYQLDKLILMSSHSKPFLPTMTDGSYPILEPDNYAKLIGMRDRLAEYCKASVRLPHTLCQYLAWRYGRVYRTGDSEKAGLVLYNLIPLTYSMTTFTDTVQFLLGFVAGAASVYGYVYSASEKASAQADLYNAYRDHTIDVPVLEETQFIYDRKEFVLRTNLDIMLTHLADNQVMGTYPTDLVYMDSTLDNKTTFMASTVSTAYNTSATGSFLDIGPLFPVSGVRAHFIHPTWTTYPEYFGTSVSRALPAVHTPGQWVFYRIDMFIDVSPNALMSSSENPETAYSAIQGYICAASLCKALEFYNVEIYTPSVVDMMSGLTGTTPVFMDLTAPSTDLAKVENEIIGNTQVYAFANLVCEEVKSYLALEKPLAIQAVPKVAAEVVNDLTTKATDVKLPT